LIFFSFIPLILVLHCICIFIFKRWLGPIGTFYSSLLIYSSVLVLLLNEFYHLLLHGNYNFIDFGRWFFCLELIDSHLIFCIDNLALITSLLVILLTMFALYFGVEYMYREAFINRLLYLLNLFATSVVFLFYCYDYFLILFAWECIGLFSFLLVNFYSTRVYTIKAALKTFVFSRISDMFMFFSFILTINIFITTDLSLIFIQIPFYLFHYIWISNYAFHFITLFAFCLVTSGAIKAAQFFFHVWLPDAMEAPTPASALIHSSTLVVAGVYLIIRFSILFEFTLLINYYLVLFGALTLAFGSITATFQNDIKKLVAYSTISQIGYLICGCGFCCYEEVLIYLIIHALNKAFLFILVGYIVHFFSGNTDMRQMGGAFLYSFDITVLLFGTCFNLAGLPYSAGFIGKEFLLFQVLRDDFLTLMVRGCWLVSFFFTPIYMFILVFIVMFGPKKGFIGVYSTSWVISSTYFSWNNFTNLQYTIITSRLTSYILFVFWLFFFFFGEILLLLIFNYSTLTDSITSTSFFTIKQHIIFYIFLNTQYLLLQINFYIFILTISAVLYLFNLIFQSSYRLFYYNYLITTTLFLITLYLYITT